MPQRDIYHDAVKNALIADGWTITHDPLPLTFGRHNLFVDIGASAPFAAQKDARKIAVEIKSFLGASAMTDLERALGQYVFYGFLLERQDPERMLYLALTEVTYLRVLDEADGRDLVSAQNIRLLIFDPGGNKITRWIP